MRPNARGTRDRARDGSDTSAEFGGSLGNVPSRRPGLGIDEKAEAVRLARAGVSMRAIGRRMGVDRKAVRAALVEAGLIVDEASDDS